MFRRVFKGKEVLHMMRDLSEWFSNLTADTRYCIEVKEHREKRSLDANAYAWVLIGQIAKSRGLDAEEVYRACIRKSGGTYIMQMALPEAEAVLRRTWCANGAGWMVDVLGRSVDNPKMMIYRCWYGSSTFDTKEMANLIDNLIQDAQALGIDTTTPMEQQRLLEAWNEKHLAG